MRNIENRKEYLKRYYAKNIKSIRLKAKEYRDVNKDKFKKVSHEWYIKNAKQVKIKSKNYYLKNKKRLVKVKRAYRLKTNYGLSVQDYAKMFNSQNGVCKICKKPETTIIKNARISLSVDHCHKTGKVRGLLCRHCNNAIGLLWDDPKLLKSALKYLEKSLEMSSDK